MGETGAGNADANNVAPLFSRRPRGMRDLDAGRSAYGGGRNSERRKSTGHVSLTSTGAHAAAAADKKRRPRTGLGKHGKNNGEFELDRFGRRIPRPDPTPLENARKFEKLRDGWNHSTAAGHLPTNAEFTRGVGWDESLVSGVEAMEMAEGGGFGGGGGEGGSEFDAGSGSVGGTDDGYSFLRTDCRAGWRKTTRGEGKNRPKLDMVFGDDFAELVGAGATRVGWIHGEMIGAAVKPGEVNVNKALGASVWTPYQDHAAAARRVEAAKYSAASMGRDAVIARREAMSRGREVAAKKKAAEMAAEEARLRAERLNRPIDHSEELMKRMAKIRERTGDFARANFNAQLRERNLQDEKVRKSNTVRMMRKDIKLMEDIRARQTARLRAMEKAEQEEEELREKERVVLKVQAIFRHYLPLRLKRAKEALAAKAAQSGVAPKKVHQTLDKVKLTYRQEKSLGLMKNVTKS